jgi:hypothetical protein
MVAIDSSGKESDMILFDCIVLLVSKDESMIIDMIKKVYIHFVKLYKTFGLYLYSDMAETMKTLPSSNDRQYSLEKIQTILFESISLCLLDSFITKRIDELEKNLIIPLNDDVSTSMTEHQYNGQKRSSAMVANVGSNGWIRNGSHDVKPSDRHGARRSGQPGYSRSKQGIDSSSRPKDPELSMECWESIRNFKPTEFIATEGVAKMKNDLSAIFNKLSKSTFREKKPSILEKITDIIEPTLSTPVVSNELIQHMFTLSSANKMMGDMYAELYKDLSPLTTLFKEIVSKNIEQYCDSIQDIYYVDPESDYDGFCQYNKKNDHRKSIITFIVYLMINGLVESETVLRIMIDFIGLIESLTNEEKKINEVDEITENLFLMISLSYKTLKQESIWIQDIQPKIEEISKRKTKEYKSLSSRAIFKYMDLVDFMKR